MKIDYISDCHIDFWLGDPNQTTDKLKRNVSNYIKNVLKPKDGNILIIAGDLGHRYTQDKEVLTQLKEYYNRIVLTTGNHDLYLISNSIRKKYFNHSFNRVVEMKNFCEKNSIDYLDGDIITIDGKVIAGFPGWYIAENEFGLGMWRRSTNDSRLIREFGFGFNSKKYYESNLKKLKDFENLSKDKNIDILFSHVSQVKFPSGFGESYNSKKFYEVDNEKIIQNINPQIYIFGHMHEKMNFMKNETICLCNPLGYDDELGTKIEQIEI